MITDNEILIDAAKRNYNNFLVPTGMITSDKADRFFTEEQKSDLDLKTSVNKIGEIINFSQILNSILWDRLSNGEKIEDVQDLYYDIAQLDVMSNIEIDKAKKVFTINNEYELKKLKKKYNMYDEELGLDIRPKFFEHLARKKNLLYKVSDDGSKVKTKSYKKHETSMDYLQDACAKLRHRDTTKNEYVEFVDVLNRDLYDYKLVKYDQVYKTLSLLQNQYRQNIIIWSNEELDFATKRFYSEEVNNTCVEAIKATGYSYNTAFYILSLISNDRFEIKSQNFTISNEEFKKIRTKIFYTLLGSGNRSFYSVISKSKKDLEYLVPDEDGEINIYCSKYTKKYKKRIISVDN